MSLYDRVFNPAPKHGHADKKERKRTEENMESLKLMHTPQDVHAAETKDYARRATIIFGCRDL